MDKFQLHISGFTLEDKPHEFDVRTQVWDHYLVYSVDVQQMAANIGQGRCWRNGQYDLKSRNFKQENVVGSRFLALDFDESEFSPHEVVNHAKKLGITPNIWYYSFSQGIKPGNNFRTIWIFDELMDVAEFNDTMEYMLKTFEDFKCDGNAADISRMWYSGSMGCAVINEVLHKRKDWNVPVSNYKPSRSSLDSSVDLKNNFTITIDSWEADLDRHCPLWRKFKSGEFLSRTEWFVLAGNLRLIKGARERVAALIDWETYEGHSIDERQLDYWWRDDTIRPARIIEVKGRKYSVAEWMGNRAF